MIRSKFTFLAICSFFLVAFCYSSSSCAQSSVTRLPVRKDGQWGIIDKNGKVIVPTNYSFADADNFGWIRLEKDGQWTVADKMGKLLLPLENQEIIVVDSLLIAFKKNDKYGFLSANGKQTAAKFDKAIAMRNSYALGQIGLKTKERKFDLINPESKTLIEEADTAYFLYNQYGQSNVVVAEKQGKKYLPNLNDENLSKQPLQRIMLMANNFVRFGAGRPLGIADEHGNIVVETKYADIVPLSMDFVALKPPTQNWLLFDLKNKKALTESSFTYFEVLDKAQVQHTRIIACQDNACGILDENGKWILQPTYEQIYNLQNYLLAGKNAQNQWAILDTNGKKLQNQLVDLIYDFADFSMFTKVETTSGEGLISKKGELVLPTTYTSIEVFPNKNQTTVFAYQNEKITVIEFEHDKKIRQTSYPSFSALPTHLSRLSKSQVFTARIANRISSEYRWVQNPTTKKYYLRNKEGGFAFQNNFDVILIDPLANFTLGKNNVNGSLSESSLIDHQNGKLIATNKLFHVELADFRIADVARAYADSAKENALLTKTGLVVRELAGKIIDTMMYFSEKRMSVKAGGKWGVIDEKGRMLVPPQYDEIMPFRHGTARIKQENLYGLIDNTGKVILPIQYEYVGEMEDGLALIVQNKQVGIVNRDGKVVIVPQYERMSIEPNGILRARKNNLWALLNTKNEIILPFEWQYISTFSDNVAAIRKNNLWGFVNHTGKILAEPSFEAQFVGETQHERAKVGIGRYVEENEFEQKEAFYKKNGIIRTDGTWILEPIYSFIDERIFSTQKAAVLIEKDHKVGYADQDGKILVAPIYDEISPDFEMIYLQNKGVAWVRNKNKIGYIDHTGKELIPTEFDKITSYEKIYNIKDAVTVAQKNNKYGTIDRHNNTIVPFEYDFIGMDSRNDTLSFVKKNGKWGVINPFGQTIVPITFSAIKYLQEPHTPNALIEVFLDSAVNLYLDEKGQFATQRPSSNINIVQENGKYGLKDQNGNWIVKPIYQQLEDFGKIGKSTWTKVAILHKGTLLYGVIDATGKTIIEPNYLDLGIFSEGKIAARQNHKSKDKQLWGYLDEKGKVVIDFAYYAAAPFKNDRAKVKLSRAGQKISYINSKNEVVIKSDFMSGSEFGKNVAIAENYLIDKNGTRLQRLPFREVKTIGGFENGIVAIETEKGCVHLTEQGKVLYPTYFDAITPFRKGIAFVKTGERWQLLRRSSIDPDTIRLNFSTSAMKRYLEKYGKKRLIQNKYGEKTVDLGFEKVDEGYWLMIDENGNFVSPMRYTHVEVYPTYTVLTTNGVYGYIDLNGKWIAYPQFPARQYSSGYTIRLENGKDMKYLRLDGTWIW